MSYHNALTARSLTVGQALTTGQALETWNREVSAAVALLGEPAFFATLIDALSAILPVDYPQVWLYSEAKPEPQVLFHRLTGALRQRQVEDYRAGAYRTDPFYQLCHDGDLAAGFSHWRATGEQARGLDAAEVCDEVVFSAALDQGQRVHLCLMRARAHRCFGADELALLEACSPMVVQLIQRHMALSKPAGIEAGVRQAVSLFGRSLLTSREQDVLGLMLSGYSTRFAADKLGISPETLRRHRKNIYQKLDVSSQSEVFSLFISSLGCFDAAPTEDPLHLYFGRQQPA